MRALLACLTLVMAVSVFGAAPERFVAGTHYEELPTPVTTREASKIEVVEAFSYGCPHCNSLEPLLAAWRPKLAADVDFQRMPVVWNSQFRMFGQGYFTAVSLGVAEKTHAALFEALHEDGKALTTPELLAGFYAENGVGEGDFMQVFSSFGVRAEVQQAAARTQAYRITGVPTLIVDGRYKVEAGGAGGQAQMLEVVDFLVARERAKRPAATAPVAQ